MDTNLNHEQSLTLINEMINRARNNFHKGSTTTMIFWGYLVAAVATANFVLLHTLKTPNQAYIVWLLMIPGAVISYFVNWRVDQTVLVKTHLDKIANAVWTGFMIGVAVFIAIIYMAAYRLDFFGLLQLITPVIILMIGIGQFATACVYRSQQWYWVAILFWVGSLTCAFVRPDWQFIILAACMVLGYIVPGHLLNRKYSNSNV